MFFTISISIVKKYIEHMIKEVLDAYHDPVGKTEPPKAENASLKSACGGEKNSTIFYCT